MPAPTSTSLPANDPGEHPQRAARRRRWIARVLRHRTGKVSTRVGMMIGYVCAVGVLLRYESHLGRGGTLQLVMLLTALYAWSAGLRSGGAARLLGMQPKPHTIHGLDPEAGSVASARGCMTALIWLGILILNSWVWINVASHEIPHMVALFSWFTPTALTLLIRDSIWQPVRAAGIAAALLAEAKVSELIPALGSLRKQGAPVTLDGLAGHPCLRRVTATTTGGDAGLRHLRRVSDSDPSDDRRVAASLLLEHLGRRSRTSWRAARSPSRDSPMNPSSDPQV